MTPLAEFEFKNLDYELIDEAKDEVYVNIDRELRTTPFVGMKQPTPIGGILGLEIVLKIKHKGEPAEYPWKLYSSNRLIQSGTTNAKGHSRGLNILMPYGVYTSYELVVYEPQKSES